MASSPPIPRRSAEFDSLTLKEMLGELNKAVVVAKSEGWQITEMLPESRTLPIGTELHRGGGLNPNCTSFALVDDTVTRAKAVERAKHYAADAGVAVSSFKTTRVLTVYVIDRRTLEDAWSHMRRQAGQPEGRIESNPQYTQGNPVFMQLAANAARDEGVIFGPPSELVAFGSAKDLPLKGFQFPVHSGAPHPHAPHCTLYSRANGETSVLTPASVPLIDHSIWQNNAADKFRCLLY